MKRRIFITGVGVISAIGHNYKAFSTALQNGLSGIDVITSFDTQDMGTIKGGEIKGFNPMNYFSKKELKRVDRASQLCLVAVEEAVNASGLTVSTLNQERCGVSFGTLLGSIGSGAQYYKQLKESHRAYASRLLDFPLYSAGTRVCIKYGFLGPNLAISTACSASNVAIGYAYDLIKSGIVDVMIVGGFDAMSEMACGGFGVLRNLSHDVCRPFDKNRKGLVLGEGSACLVLEESHHCERRSGKVYAELLGYGMSNDAYHMTAPDITGKGPAQAMRTAINNSGIRVEDIHYINAHGTGTFYNDLVETVAIKKVFGERAYKIPISSTKSMHGHTLGATGAIEAVASVAVIQNHFIPPTINYETPDPKCDLNYVPNQSREGTIDIVLSNGFGFGGNNCSIIIKRVNENK